MPDFARPFRWFARNAKPETHGEPVPITLERNRDAAVEMGAENPPDLPRMRGPDDGGPQDQDQEGDTP